MLSTHKRPGTALTSIALEALSIADELAGRPDTAEVFLVGCGASLADLYPARYFLEQRTASLRVGSYTANEFVHATPAALGERSVLIACSHGGGTRETVEAARAARDAGALTVSLTNNRSAEISRITDRSIRYEWGPESAVCDNPIAITLALALEILARTEDVVDYDDFRLALEQIDDLVQAARRSCRERTKTFADACGDEQFWYVLSSGASYQHAYAFAVCSLMEMQWLDASAIHCGEFFHGPFEITDRETPFILLMNEGRTRPLDERVRRFLDQYANTVEVIDASTLGLSALAPSVVDYFNPVLFASVLNDYREALAEVRGHPIDKRRYMGKVDY